MYWNPHQGTTLNTMTNPRPHAADAHGADTGAPQADPTTARRRMAAPRSPEAHTSAGQKFRYFVSATIKVLKANSGMLLSCVAAVLLALLAYGDQMGGVELQGVYDFHVVVLQLVGLWFMVTGIGALDAMPRVNKSFNGAEGMLRWNKIATVLGLVVEWVAYVMRRAALGSTHNTVDKHVSDTVLLVVLVLVTVLAVLRYVGPNMRHAPRRGPGAWIARIPFDVIYPVFTVSLVVLWVVLAWQMWETSVLNQSMPGTSGSGADGAGSAGAGLAGSGSGSSVADAAAASGIAGTEGLPCLLSAYCLVIIAAALVVLRVTIIQQFRTDRLYPGTVVKRVYPNPNTVIVNVELEPRLQRGRPVGYWYTAGQYSYLGVPGQKGGPHPFTMTSIPNVVGRTGPTQHVGVGSRMRTQGTAWDRQVEYCIKAGGKGSRWLVDNLYEGMPVTVSTPRGGAHPAHGGVRQLWVAGGIGITPFVAWLRDLNLAAGEDFPGHVTLVWSYRPSEKPAYVNLVRECAQGWGWLTLVEVDTESGERLTPQQAHRIAFPLEGDESTAGADADPGALPAAGTEAQENGATQTTGAVALSGVDAVAGEAAPLYGEDITIHMCGPTDLCADYHEYFLEQGVSPDRMHVDAFHMR